MNSVTTQTYNIGLLNQIKKDKLPRHIAVIMDGNGRWAKKRGLLRIAGHRAGAKSVKEIVRTCGELGIEVLTLYAFSVENWNRPKKEVNSLMNLLKAYLKKEVPELMKDNVKLVATGRIHELPEDTLNKLKESIKETSFNTGLILNLAINYSGRAEIIDVVKKIINEKISPDDLSENIFAKYLYTAGLPEPDLLIRTSGEMRVSNFLLWQIAYTEIWITDVLWPDFRKNNLLEAINDYQKRERRFGKIE